MKTIYTITFLLHKSIYITAFSKFPTPEQALNCALVSMSEKTQAMPGFEILAAMLKENLSDIAPLEDRISKMFDVCIEDANIVCRMKAGQITLSKVVLHDL